MWYQDFNGQKRTASNLYGTISTSYLFGFVQYSCTVRYPTLYLPRKYKKSFCYVPYHTVPVINRLCCSLHVVNLLHYVTPRLQNANTNITRKRVPKVVGPQDSHMRHNVVRVRPQGAQIVESPINPQLTY